MVLYRRTNIIGDLGMTSLPTPTDIARRFARSIIIVLADESFLDKKISQQLLENEAAIERITQILMSRGFDRWEPPYV
jgi:hypothetical protein